MEPAEPAVEPQRAPAPQSPLGAPSEPPEVTEPAPELPRPGPQPEPPTSVLQPEPAVPPEPTQAEVTPDVFAPEPGPAPALPRPDANGLPVPALLPDSPPVPPQAEPPAEPAGAVPAPAPPISAEPDRSARVAPDADNARGLIAISVPAEARVFINGLQTKSQGPYREYVSYGLKPGSTYKYEIRAEIQRGGRLVRDTRTVYLTAGARKQLAFHLDAEPQAAIAALW